VVCRAWSSSSSSSSSSIALGSFEAHTLQAVLRQAQVQGPNEDGKQAQQQRCRPSRVSNRNWKCTPRGMVTVNRNLRAPCTRICLPSSSNAYQSTGGVPAPRGSTSRAAAQQFLGHSSQESTRPQGRAAGVRSSPWQVAAASQPSPGPAPPAQCQPQQARQGG
jgi:hypothetical protein